MSLKQLDGCGGLCELAVDFVGSTSLGFIHSTPTRLLLTQLQGVVGVINVIGGGSSKVIQLDLFH